MSQFVWAGGSGCLLPVLIIFNLFFGRLIFNSARLWLGVEVLLILIFMININLMARKISRQFNQQSPGQQSRRSQEQVVDIQGQVVEEDKKLE